MEKRAHERTTVGLPVRVRCSTGVEFEGTVENLGALGALLTTPDLEAGLDVGDVVSLEIVASDGTSIQAEGEVLRLEQEFAGGDIRRSFAVRFRQEVVV